VCPYCDKSIGYHSGGIARCPHCRNRINTDL
jgi:tRNA(Ile2) C34 agmatinyltransferase TiaS